MTRRATATALGIPKRGDLCKVSAKLDSSLVEEVDRIAEETNRNRTQVLHMLLCRALGRAA